MSEHSERDGRGKSRPPHDKKAGHQNNFTPQDRNSRTARDRGGRSSWRDDGVQGGRGRSHWGGAGKNGRADRPGDDRRGAGGGAWRERGQKDGQRWGSGEGKQGYRAGASGRDSRDDQGNRGRSRWRDDRGQENRGYRDRRGAGGGAWRERGQNGERGGSRGTGGGSPRRGAFRSGPRDTARDASRAWNGRHDRRSDGEGRWRERRGAEQSRGDGRGFRHGGGDRFRSDSGSQRRWQGESGIRSGGSHERRAARSSGRMGWRPEDGDAEQRDGPLRGRGSWDGDRTRNGRQGRERASRDDSVQARAEEDLRTVRPDHIDPELPEEVTERDLPFGARVELKTLTKENAEFVARHLAMVALLIGSDPELAHQHALSASRRGGRIAIVRETLAITAYTTGDFALALRELRTYRRISGRDDQLALMIDSERGLGRPDRALELGRSVDLAKLPAPERVQVAIALSGARLDQGKAELALAELEIPQLDTRRAFSYSPALFSAYADVLEDLGRSDEAHRWQALADRARRALEDAQHDERETIEVYSEDLRGDELEAFYEAHPEARPAVESEDAASAGPENAELAEMNAAAKHVTSHSQGETEEDEPITENREPTSEEPAAATKAHENAVREVTAGPSLADIGRAPGETEATDGDRENGQPAPSGSVPSEADAPPAQSEVPADSAQRHPGDRDAADLAAARLIDLEAEVDELLEAPGDDNRPGTDAPQAEKPSDEEGGEGPDAEEATLFDL